MEGEMELAEQLKQYWLLWTFSLLSEVAKPGPLPYLAESAVDPNI
jgi:hypothetical protein